MNDHVFLQRIAEIAQSEESAHMRRAHIEMMVESVRANEGRPRGGLALFLKRLNDADLERLSEICARSIAEPAASVGSPSARTPQGTHRATHV